MTSAAPSPRLLTALPQVYAAAAVRLALPLVVLPLVATRHRRGRVRPARLHPGLGRAAGDAGRGRLPRRGDAAGGRPPTPPARWRLAQQVFSARLALSLPAVLLAFAAVGWAAPGGGPPLVDALADRRARLRARLARHLVPAGDAAAQPLVAGRGRGVRRADRRLLGVRAQRARLRRPAARRLGAARACSAGAGWRADLRRGAPGRAPVRSCRAARRACVSAGKMLPVSIAGAAYSLALPAAASAQLSKPDLGVYFMADRIVRAVLAAADPVYSLVYPRIVALFGPSGRAALWYAARWAALGSVAGAALFLLVQIALAGARAAPVRPRRQHRRAAGPCRRPGPGLALAIAARLEVHRLLDARQRPARRRLPALHRHRRHRRRRRRGDVGGAHGALGLAWTSIGVELLVIVVAIAAMGAGRLRRRAG